MEKKTFTIFWLTGDSQIVRGYDAQTAMSNAGIGAGALPAMDFYADGDIRDKYIWDAIARTWKRIKQ